MKSRMMSWVLGTLPVLFSAAPLMAQEENVPKTDARLMAYGNAVNGNAAQPDGSTATMWMLAIALGLLAFGVMFKNAKRTHLD